MADSQTGNVRIYNRPENKMPSPLMLALGMLLIVVLGFLAYRMFFHAAPTPAKSPTVSWQRWQEPTQTLATIALYRL